MRSLHGRTGRWQHVGRDAAVHQTLSNGEFDLSAPNEAYFAHVDTIIRMAATNGIQIMLNPLDTGG